MTLTQIKPAGLSKPVDLADNEKIRLGTGNDLQIYHDSTNSLILNSTGYLGIRSNTLYLQDYTNGHAYITCVQDGAVGLRYDNSQKLETTSSGITVTGTITPTGNITFADSSAGGNNRITFGGGADLQIWHDGSNSRIADEGTGALRISSSDARITNAAGTEDMARFIEDGAVELYHNNVKKLETQSAGVDITGNLQATGNVQVNDNGHLYVGNSGDLDLYHDGSDSVINNNGGNLYINAKTGETAIRINRDAGVKLYYDNSTRIETLTEGAKVKRSSGGSTTLYIEGAEGGSAILDMFADDGDDIADKFRFNAATDGTFYMQNYANNGWQSNITYTGAGNVELYHNGSKKLETKSNGVEISSALGIANVGGTLAGSGGSENWLGIKDSAGNFQFAVKTAGTNNGSVGIGTTSPAQNLHNTGTTRLDGKVGVGATASHAQLCSYVTGAASYPPSGGLVQSDNSSHGLQVWNGNNSAAYSALKLETKTTGASIWLMSNVYNSTFSGDLTFLTRTGGSSNSERVRFRRDGGITFNGDTAAANALDDYEEGTFSATATATGYSGGNAIALHDETYTKIGRIVHFNCRLQVASNLNDGDLSLSGLPFSAAQDSVVDFSWQDAAGFHGGQGKIASATCIRFNGTFPTHSSGTANIIFSGTYRT